jgi:transcriptional regulator with XRE-family HTH domain
MNKLRQNYIALKAGISPPYVSLIINGKKRPTWSTAKKLSIAVPGTNPELWLEGSPDEIRAALKKTATSTGL